MSSPGVGDNRARAAAEMVHRWAAAGGGVYLGAAPEGVRFAGRERAVLVLGPPRSGKTSSLVVPSVLAAPGPVVSTSTKPDVLQATVAARAAQGPCLVYDPSGTVTLPSGTEPLRWSPVAAAGRWDDALLLARAVVGATRGASGRDRPTDHWTERAEALLAPLLHAASVEQVPMSTVLSWVDRHQAGPALGILDTAGTPGAAIAADLLAGIAATDEREQSGIWSTASGVLAAYRSEAALASTVRPDFDADAFCASGATLYLCATGRHQGLVAPLVVGLLSDVRAAAYRRAAAGAAGPPVLLALDEVANIAPLHDLPAMVSEGGGQGLVTLACLQDLSQARSRWGEAASGFLSLFGVTVVLPGIGDTATLRALSALAGEQQVVTRSVSVPEPPPIPGLLSRLLGRRAQPWPTPPSVTHATVRRPRLPLDELAQGHGGFALVLDERNRMSWVRLTPWFAEEPWRSAARGQSRQRPVEPPGASQRHPEGRRHPGDRPFGIDLGH